MVTKFIVITEQTEAYLKAEASRLSLPESEIISYIIAEYRKIRSASGGDQSDCLGDD